MAAKGDDRIASATFLAAQVDFSEAGDLLVFIDDSQLNSLEEMMAEQGYLDGSRMAAVFNMLRPRDLIWPYVVNNYLLGKKPFPFDLLFWNADSTRLPAANHAFYLREFYHLNRSSKGEMQLGGVQLDLGRVNIPIYELVHQRRSHRAGPLGVSSAPSCSVVRCGSSWRARAISPAWSTRRARRNINLVGRHCRLSCRLDGAGDRNARVVVAGLGGVARGLFGRQSPGARSGCRARSSRSRTRPEATCKPGLGARGPTRPFRSRFPARLACTRLSGNWNLCLMRRTTMGRGLRRGELLQSEQANQCVRQGRCYLRRGDRRHSMRVSW